VFDDPQVRHLGMAQPVEHPKLGPIEVVGQAVTLSRAPNRIRSATPEAGEHTGEVLRELGFSDDDVARLRSARIV
jgi:crotonobetainyl-CoA:carnitine CoA-transferase CaiB-like acyl-CoA transferase